MFHFQFREKINGNRLAEGLCKLELSSSPYLILLKWLWYSHILHKMCKLGSIGIHTDTESVSGFSEDGPGEARKQTVMMGPLGGPQNTGESRAFCRLLGVLGKLGAIKLLSQFLGRDGRQDQWSLPRDRKWPKSHNSSKQNIYSLMPWGCLLGRLLATQSLLQPHDHGIKPMSPVLWEDSLPSEPPGKPKSPGETSHPPEHLTLPCWVCSGAWQNQIKGLNRLLRGDLGEGNGTPLQYSCLENPMDGGA